MIRVLRALKAFLSVRAIDPISRRCNFCQGYCYYPQVSGREDKCAHEDKCTYNKLIKEIDKEIMAGFEE